MASSEGVHSNTEFLNAIRDVLGLCPLPHSKAAGIETFEFNARQSSLDIGWASGERLGLQ